MHAEQKEATRRLGKTIFYAERRPALEKESVDLWGHPGTV